MKTERFSFNPLLLSLLFLFLAIACSDDDEISPDHPVDCVVRGNVEKGPFISGSTIDMQPLDADLNPLGTMYTATISDDAGSFQFPSQTFTSPYVHLSTTGYFFNEVEGDLSKGTIRLEAIVDITDPSLLHVNLLTHLKAGRTRQLVSDGSSVKQAAEEAQKELLTQFGLQKYNTADVSRFSMPAGTDEAGALIVVSSALLYHRSEAELTEYVSKMSREFAAGGQLSDQTKKQYREDCKALNLNEISNHIVERYRSLGKKVDVKPLKYYVDWNDDEIAGNEFGNDDGRLAFEIDTLCVPAEGGSYKVGVLTDMDFVLGNFPDDFFSPSNFKLFNTKKISLTKKIDGKNLLLDIAPATAYRMKNASVSISSPSNDQTAKLVIVQEGDKNLPPFTPDGSDRLTQTIEKMAEATYYLRTMEALYTHTYQTGNDDDPFEINRIDPSNSVLLDSWSAVYFALTRIRTLDRIGKQEELETLPTFAFWTASLYYELAVLWENIPYVENLSDFPNIEDIPQKNSRELFSLLETNLVEQTDRFENKKNAFDKLEDYVFFSNDFPRLVLAKMHLYQQEYEQARTFLKAIVSDGHYRLAASRTEALQKESPELIWGYRNPEEGPTGGSDIYYRPIRLDEYLPFGTYTEVLLSLAECEYRLGNTTAATDYLNQVASKRGLQTSGEFLSALQAIWASELKGTGTYFAFLKRNGLAEKTLNIEPFRLLFPIPFSEVALSPLVQNPGY